MFFLPLSFYAYLLEHCERNVPGVSKGAVYTVANDIVFTRQPQKLVAVV